MKTVLLNSLYVKYNIENLTFGTIYDKLGDVYKEYYEIILNTKSYLDNLKYSNIASLEEYVLYHILT